MNAVRPDPEISLVIPVKNERQALEALFERLIPIVAGTAAPFEIVVVNDGSTDETLAWLLLARRRIPQLRVLDLSRNFGKEAALTAGLRHCRGRCAVMLDADLQDPPELIPQMVEKWREGYETVVAQHSDRQSDSAAKRWSANWFYRLMNGIAEIEILADAGDFRLLDRAVIDAFLALPERSRFNKGLFAWLGFRTFLIRHERPPRQEGASKFNFRRLWRLAIDGITSFSSLPLRVWTYIGFLIASAALCYGLYITVRTLIYGVDVPGYASLMVTITFLGGINLIGLGVLGEYIGRIFQESKRRPLYIVRRIYDEEEDTYHH